MNLVREYSTITGTTLNGGFTTRSDTRYLRENIYIYKEY